MDTLGPHKEQPHQHRASCFEPCLDMLYCGQGPEFETREDRRRRRLEEVQQWQLTIYRWTLTLTKAGKS